MDADRNPPHRCSRPLAAALFALALGACTEAAKQPVEAGMGPKPVLPKPVHRALPTVNIAEAAGWPEGRGPTPASGMRVNAFAGGLDHPRWIYVLPNGDVLVAESSNPPPPPDQEKKGSSIKRFFMKKAMKKAGSAVPSANRITLLRDADGDGVAEVRTAFLENLFSPFGMALVGNDFYVANADAVVRFPYNTGDTRIAAEGVQVAPLPAGLNHHWTKNLIASADGTRLYATVGSNSNVGENGMDIEVNRAAILEIVPATGKVDLFASGLRNPNGMDWEPVTGMLWTVVNERDELGSDLVPDYLTSVQRGGFYGWPYSYFGQNVDERVKPPRPDLVAKAIVPDYALGPHTASLGLVFYDGAWFAPKYRGGAFIGQHGSWNRKPASGYKVIFVPFANGKPAGAHEDILTGFRVDDVAYGRPVGVAVAGDGALLVADDVGNIIWRVTPDTPRPPLPVLAQPGTGAPPLVEDVPPTN
jgi:glucose/arabinose dehydrogenase